MKPLSIFIDSNYLGACDTQRSFDHDDLMVNMHKSACFKKEEIRKWMRNYGLFQGITSINRDRIIDTYIDVLPALTKDIQNPSKEQILKLVNTLLIEFYKTVPRKWLSAVTKLLWCSYPSSVVIFDAFVYRALIVLQGQYERLSNLPRLTNSPKIKDVGDLEGVVDFYNNYQSLVIALLSEHQSQLNSLRLKYTEKYQYDVRILDKLLWLLGGPGQKIKYKKISCT